MYLFDKTAGYAVMDKSTLDAAVSEHMDKRISG